MTGQTDQGMVTTRYMEKSVAPRIMIEHIDTIHSMQKRTGCVFGLNFGLKCIVLADNVLISLPNYPFGGSP
ncbi:hypothetical protein ASPBRDRAFT_49404 [Aspergillus brasiliensis CBS 101740]|uniref:Uncharacterized protein n=1 Tax=Aspergillus brasiliensis (strain CBS 101740 / IMI 381727 / IBT 21946) TaxID=767769 RepID=A0A1L9U2H1_ASPBC|nr:hypothetical protein ASPBRDRAFT_49404 [Aspergillus brasiliensis CBS 101740]